MSRKPCQTRLRAQARPPAPTCRPRVSRAWATGSPGSPGTCQESRRPPRKEHCGPARGWGRRGGRGAAPGSPRRVVPGRFPLLIRQSVSALLVANGQTPCPRHSQAPGQLAPDPETGTLARLPSPVLLAAGRARDPEDSPWASLAAVNGLHAAWLSEKEKNRPSDPNWWKRF